MSDAGLGGSPRNSSGAIAIGVPTVPAAVPCRSLRDQSTPAPKSIRTMRPPRSRMTFGGLDVAVDEAGRVDGGQRPAQVEADQGRLLGAQRSLLREPLLQRGAGHEVGPQPDAAVVDVGAVHDDDVGVADPSEAARLLDEVATGRGRRGRVRAPELERDLAVEDGIVRPEHLAGTAVAELLDDLEVAPLEENALRRRSVPGPGGGGVVLPRARAVQGAVRGGDRLDHLEVARAGASSSGLVGSHDPQSTGVSSAIASAIRRMSSLSPDIHRLREPQQRPRDGHARGVGGRARRWPRAISGNV